VTPAQLRLILPQCRDVAFWSRELQNAVPFGVNTAARWAAFIAQVAHESAQFTRLVEGLSYSVRGLMTTWPQRFPTERVAQPFARNPERLANYVYANRLGNGPPESGDGWRYRGRGLIQITGKANYTTAGVALGLPLVAQPAMLERPTDAVRSAAWFWQSRHLNELADADSLDAFEAITRRINGGLTGFAERIALWRKAQQALA
jgi:putative chitinase